MFNECENYCPEGRSSPLVYWLLRARAEAFSGLQRARGRLSPFRMFSRLLDSGDLVRQCERQWAIARVRENRESNKEKEQER